MPSKIRFLLVVLAVFVCLCAACQSGNAAVETGDEPLVEEGEAPQNDAPMDEAAQAAEEGEAAVIEETPVNTDEPAPAPTEIPEQAEAAASACSNRYFPVVGGSRYLYGTFIEEFPEMKANYEVAYSDVTEDGFASIVRMDRLDDNGDVIEGEYNEMEIQWHCDENGMLQEVYNSFLFYELDESVQLEFETLTFEGITFPVGDTVEIGSSWETNYVVSMEATEDGETLANHITIHQIHTAAGFEPLSTAYGDYPEALLVETTGDLVIKSTDEDGNTFTYTLPVKVSTWYVEGIGAVKMVSYDEGFTTVQLLVEMRLQ